MGSTLCSVLTSVCRTAGEDGVETIQRHETDDIFPSWCKTRRKEVGRRPNVLLWALFHLFRPTYNIVSLLLEFSLEK